MLDTIRKILRSSGAEPSASEIERAIVQIDERVAKAIRDRDDLVSRRVDALLESDESSARLRKQIAHLEDELADLSVARDRLFQNLEQAQQREAKEAKNARYDAAIARRDQTLKALRTRLPKHIREHYALIRLIEECRADVEPANADLPAGAAYIEDAEAMLRDLASIPEETISEAREIVWSRTDVYPAERIDPEKVRDFRDLGGGRGQFVERTQRVGGQTYTVATDQIVPCQGLVQVKRTVRSLDFGQRGERLRNVSMPGLRWHEPGYVPPGYPDASPSSVLRALAVAETQVPEPDRDEPTVYVIPSTEELP